MQITKHFGILAALSLLLAACGGPTGENLSDSSTSDTTSDSIPEALRRLPQYPSAEVCPQAHQPGFARCLARVRTTNAGLVANAATPQGFGPSDLRDAYKLPSTGGSGITVAIVDAQDDPKAEQDLATYRSTYGLPPCTTANGCFKKVNQNGVQGSYPTADTGWAGEIALDIEMVSATCPSCKILLVEATTANMDDLGAAVNTAVNLGAQVISNSYGGSEDSTIATADTNYFHHPGVAIFVSAGDSGYGTEYPASSQYVTAVGGTALARSTSASRGWVESVWGTATNTNGGTGSGCSKYIAKPTWQTDTGCSKRMVADVSAVADPNTGVAVYDTYGGSGWAVYGGTSVASPVVAGIYALTNHTSDALGFSYSHTSAFFDVTSGTNGTCSTSTPYFCKAQSGFDGPTGFGTPNGAALVGGGGTTSNDFSLTLNTTNVALTQGASKTVTVTTAVISGTAQSVSLSVSGLPSGVTGSFSPASVTAGASSTLTLTASSTAAAASATFTVTGSATSGSHTATGTVTVSTSSGGGTNVLSNGVPVTGLSGATGAKAYYTLTVPSGASNLKFTISGGTGDADLYVKFGAQPTTSSYDCRPYVSGNSETCSMSSATAGTWYVMLNGYAAYSGVTLTASYTTGSGGGTGGNVLTNGTAVTISGASGSSTNYTLPVTAGTGNVTVSISGGSGDADLYVKFGSAPTSTSYDCRPYLNGNNESCTIPRQAGTVYIMVKGYASYSGVSLLGKF